MTRTNIDIDEQLVAAVMAENGLSTKRAAVEFALRRTIRKRASKADLASLDGVGFSLDMNEIRPADAEEHVAPQRRGR